MKTLLSLCPSALLPCLGVILSGCTDGGSVVAARLPSAKRIGVVSLLGDKAYAHTTGLTVFEIRSHPADAADWRIDATVSDAVVQSVHARAPGAPVISLPAERANVRSPGAFHPSLLSGTGDNRKLPLEEDARQLAARNRLDLVILVVPWEAPGGGSGILVSANDSVPREPGYGVSTLNLLGLHKSDARVFVNYGVGVYDGATGKELAFRSGSKQAGTPGDTEEVPGRGSLAEYSPHQRDLLAALTRQTVVKEVTERLHDLGLAP